MVLTGTEVKSLRQGRITLGSAYADVRDGELWLIGVRGFPPRRSMNPHFETLQAAA
jgi:tmRNA-binding protein